MTEDKLGALLVAFVGEACRGDDGTFVVEDRWDHVYCNLGVNREKARVFIEFIETEPGFRRQGRANAAFGEIMTWADQHAVILELHPGSASTMGGTVMDTDALEAWYRRKGFKAGKDASETWVRIPQLA